MLICSKPIRNRACPFIWWQCTPLDSCSFLCFAESKLRIPLTCPVADSISSLQLLNVILCRNNRPSCHCQTSWHPATPPCIPTHNDVALLTSTSMPTQFILSASAGRVTRCSAVTSEANWSGHLCDFAGMPETPSLNTLSRASFKHLFLALWVCCQGKQKFGSHPCSFFFLFFLPASHHPPQSPS